MVFLCIGWDVAESPEKLEPQVTLMVHLHGEQKGGYALCKRIAWICFFVKISVPKISIFQFRETR